MTGERTSAGVVLPTQFEANCYRLCKFEEKTQEETAKLLGVPQSRVSRAIRRTESKLTAVKKSKLFDADEIDTVLRRLSGAATRAA